VAATVTISALILDPTVIASSVNLQQLDAQGRVLKVVGHSLTMVSMADATAGHRKFTIRIPLLRKRGALTYRVSAGVLAAEPHLFDPVNFNITGATPTASPSISLRI